MQTQTFTNEQLVKKFGDDANLAKVISGIEAEMWNVGEVICEIYVDDQFVPEEQEKTMGDLDVKSFKKLTLLSRNHEELVSSTVEAVLEFIPKIRETSKVIAKDFRNNSGRGKPDEFVDLIEHCTWVSESLYLLRPMYSAQKPEADGDWGRAEMFFTNVAREALQAYENSDNVLLGDILEFDLPSSLDKWTQLLV